MLLEAILAMIICRYLANLAKGGQLDKEWEKFFQVRFFIAIGLMSAGFIFNKTANQLVQWTSILFLAHIIYTIYFKPDFQTLRWIAWTIIPYLIVAFISRLCKTVAYNWYKEWDDYFDLVAFSTVAWGFFMWMYTRNQRKTMEQERIRFQQKEEEFRMSEVMKRELEVQVAQRTEDLQRQKLELEEALTELKSTQAQLIQSEKMASLGELTAGIAHEIQNPLNFVTNFSDVSVELIDEMIVELNNNNAEEAKYIAEDLKSNLDKILHHGKRADGIVKGMLQHSRNSSGQKEDTDINVLADEYLRLAYHGLRAKDKSFNATLNTAFEEFLPMINVVPQDIGRVILNLITNAFYAVSERKKEAVASGVPYEPTVSVSTRKQGSDVVVVVEDNGGGIPQEVIDKIFQPFFTTKPTGQGTGLGLSLSYDIVKAHGGELTVVSTPGAGARFQIRIPY